MMVRSVLNACLLLASVLTASAGMTREELAWRMRGEAEQLSSNGIRYNAKWLPPGSEQAWVMDCSNTVKWLYRQTTGQILPRTASDQYLSLKQKGRIRRVGSGTSWHKNLRPGDLLFWENTYRPRRKPPITHVMVYLGTDSRGMMQMAGAQGSKGVTIYTFRPEVAYGGYNWFLWFKKKGRFVAYGRVL